MKDAVNVFKSCTCGKSLKPERVMLKLIEMSLSLECHTFSSQMYNVFLLYDPVVVLPSKIFTDWPYGYLEGIPQTTQNK